MMRDRPLRRAPYVACAALALTLARCTGAVTTGDGSTTTDAANADTGTGGDTALLDAPPATDITAVEIVTPPADAADDTTTSDVTADTAETAPPPDVIEEPRVDPRCAPGVDSDGDGANNDAECAAGTDPLLPDSDADGVPDGRELAYPRICAATDASAQRRPPLTCTADAMCMTGERCRGLDPRNEDTDGDGVPDGMEDLNADGMIDVTRGETDPRLADTDGDGRPDGMSGIAICRPAGLATVVQTALTPGPVQVGFAPSWGTARRIRGTMNRGAASLDDATVQASALVASVPSMGDIRAEEMRLETLVRTALGANTTPVLLGRSFTTHENNPAITSTFRVARRTTASALRDAIVMPLVGAAAMPPMTAVGSSAEFLVDLTVVRRTMGRTMNNTDVVVAVAPRTLLEDRAQPTALRTGDLVNATALAENDRGLGYHCQTFRAGGTPKVDFVMPVDTSSSMDRYQQAIGQTAQRFFTDMSAAGLDFRVAVLKAESASLNVRMPGLTWTLGTATNGAREMAWRVTVQQFGGAAGDNLAPYPNPSGTFSSGEEPLASGVLAYEQLTATATPAATRLRAGALVAMFFIADETGTNDDTRFFGADTARWGTNYAMRLASATEFYNSRNVLTFGMVNDQATDCTRPTDATNTDMRRCLILRNGGAYIPIATATDADVAAAMARIVTAVAGAASEFRLERRPITSTLKVRVRNRDVPRSRSEGFDYDAVSNSIVFYGSMYRPAMGDEVVLSYRLWQPCPGVGGTCAADGECCAPEMCIAGRCAPPCRAEGADCTTNTDCCSPNVCVDGHCGAPRACRMMGAMCTNTADCCLPFSCIDGVCGTPVMMSCRAAGATCAASSECCTPNTCIGGVCGLPMPCRPLDGMCTNNSDCCTGVCTSGRCDRAPCRAESMMCTSPADCCSGSCIEGRCGPG